jgi:hypothetical protein
MATSPKTFVREPLQDSGGGGVAATFSLRRVWHRGAGFFQGLFRVAGIVRVSCDVGGAVFFWRFT